MLPYVYCDQQHDQSVKGEPYIVSPLYSEDVTTEVRCSPGALCYEVEYDDN